MNYVSSYLELITIFVLILSFFKDFVHLFIFREKGREGERQGEKH